jgi:hypothetical protein
MIVLVEFLCVTISLIFLSWISSIFLGKQITSVSGIRVAFLIPLALGIITWAVLTFFSFRFGLGNYDESRMPLEYPYEIIDGEFGRFLARDSAEYRQNLIALHDKEVAVAEDGIRLRNVNADSGCYTFVYAEGVMRKSLCDNAVFISVESVQQDWYFKRIAMIALICASELVLSVAVIYWFYAKRFKRP